MIVSTPADTSHRLNFAWVAFGVICIVGAAAGAAAMYAVWDHNPQLAFHENGTIHWGAWLAIGLTWFGAIAGIPCVIALIAVVVSLFRKGR
jgi:hypothetical protein